MEHISLPVKRAFLCEQKCSQTLFDSHFRPCEYNMNITVIIISYYIIQRIIQYILSISFHVNLTQYKHPIISYQCTEIFTGNVSIFARLQQVLMD